MLLTSYLFKFIQSGTRYSTDKLVEKFVNIQILSIDNDMGEKIHILHKFVL